MMIDIDRRIGMKIYKNSYGIMVLFLTLMLSNFLPIFGAEMAHESSVTKTTSRKLIDAFWHNIKELQDCLRGKKCNKKTIALNVAGITAAALSIYGMIYALKQSKKMDDSYLFKLLSRSKKINNIPIRIRNVKREYEQIKPGLEEYTKKITEIPLELNQALGLSSRIKDLETPKSSSPADTSLSEVEDIIYKIQRLPQQYANKVSDYAKAVTNQDVHNKHVIAIKAANESAEKNLEEYRVKNLELFQALSLLQNAEKTAREAYNALETNR